MGFHKLPEPDDNFRVEPKPSWGELMVGVIKHDFVPPIPVGSYIACVFRVTGYDQDCDGSAMAHLEQVDSKGDTTGWEVDCKGLYADCDIVLDAPGDLHKLIS